MLMGGKEGGPLPHHNRRLPLLEDVGCPPRLLPLYHLIPTSQSYVQACEEPCRSDNTCNTHARQFKTAATTQTRPSH